METKEQKNGHNVEEIDVIKQLMDIMGQQGMKEQSQDFVEVLRYVAGMQLQLGAMVDELQGVREQLAEMQKNQPKAVTEKLLDKVSQLQGKISSLSERLTAIKDHLIDTATQAVTAFKEKGTEEMNKVLKKGISGIKSVLENTREKMVDILTDCEKTSNQIDSIGDELKQIGNGFANVGRLIVGKGAKEVSDEKPGVGLTRVMNTPIKKNIAAFRKQIDGIDKAMEKLDKVSEGLNSGKEAQKGARVSVKEKLSQMKAKSEQTKKEPDKQKAKNKEECL